MKKFLIGMFVFAASQAGATCETEAWIQDEGPIAVSRILANISALGTSKGSILASPSKVEPDYYFHWVRDAALTMEALYALAGSSQNAAFQQKVDSLFRDYAEFSQASQLSALSTGLTGLGEPKFFVNGLPFDGPWGRPQSDGPALRALSFIPWAYDLIKKGQGDYVQKTLYDGQSKPTSIIKSDLDYVAAHWPDATYDLWEEVKGFHFFTRMTQRKALVEGAKFARFMGDTQSASHYEQQAELIRIALLDHVKNKDGIVLPTFPEDPSKPYAYKPEKAIAPLDLAVILGVLRAEQDYSDKGATKAFYPVSHPAVLTSLTRLRDSFIVNLNPAGPIPTNYAINQRPDLPGIAIGRYPGDLYSGSDNTSGANAWVLGTFAYAEAHYKLSALYQKQGFINVDAPTAAFFQALHNGLLKNMTFNLKPGPEKILSSDPRFTTIVSALFKEGEDYVLRVKVHKNADGSLSEQMDRDWGGMTSAHDLTWSYASFITAALARREALAKTKQNH